MSKILVIPGFGEITADVPYRDFISEMRKSREVEEYNPVWEKKTASDWAEALVMNTKGRSEELTLIAFSLGAYTALLAAQEVRFKKLILCSLSPFFAEQISLLPSATKEFFGKNRVADFATHPLPIRINDAVFMFGAKDWGVGISEAKSLADRLKMPFILIEGAGHELTPDYLFEIKKASLRP